MAINKEDAQFISLFHDNMMNIIMEHLMEEYGTIDDEDEHCRKCKKNHDCPAYHHHLKEKEQERQSKKPNEALSFDNIKELFGDTKTDGSTTNGFDDSELEDAYEVFEEFIKGLSESMKDEKDETEEPKKEKENTNDIYLVTNVTGSGEYTPSVFNTLTTAKDWLKECTIRNFLAAVDTDDITYEISARSYGFSASIDVPLKNDENVYNILKNSHKVEEFIWYIKSDTIRGVSVTMSDDYMASTVTYADDSFNEMHIHKISKKDGELSIESLH